MKPILDDIIPFTLLRVHDIRMGRHEAIERFYAERHKSKKRSTSKGPRTVALDAVGKAALAKFNPEQQRQILEAMANVGRKQRKDGSKSSSKVSAS